MVCQTSSYEGGMSLVAVLGHLGLGELGRKQTPLGPCRLPSEQGHDLTVTGVDAKSYHGYLGSK